jgi:uncharacterized protein YjiS (DUF1127 family)
MPAMTMSLAAFGRSLIMLTGQIPSWRGLAALPRAWNQRLQDRHELSMMDDARLRDIGLTRERVQREISKPFWEA